MDWAGKLRGALASVSSAMRGNATLLYWCLVAWSWLTLVAYPRVGAPLTFLVWALVLPLGQRLLTRVVVLTGCLVVSAYLAFSLGVPLDHGRVSLAAGIVAAVLLAASTLRGRTPTTRVGISDAVLVAASLITWVIVVRPVLGAAPDQILASMGEYQTNWDHSSHFGFFADAIRGNGEAPTTSDGAAVMLAGYPMGGTAIMRVIALALFRAPGALERTALLWPYAAASAVCVSLAVLALGWIAVDLARRSGRAHAQFWAAMAVSLMATLGNLVLPLSDSGHGLFLLGAALTAALAWVVYRSAASRRALAWLVIPVGVIVGLAMWPPLAATAAAPILLLLWSVPRFGRMLVGAAVACGVVLLILVADGLPFGGSTTAELAVLLGHNAPVNLMIGLVGLPLCVAAAFWLPGLDTGARAGVGLLAVPMLACAVAFGLSADQHGFYWGWSYYAIKIANAGTLAVTALVLGMVGVLGAQAIASLDQGSRATRLALNISFLALLVLPMGYAGPGIMRIKPEVPLATSMSSLRSRSEQTRALPVGRWAVAAARVSQPGAPPVFADAVGPLQNIWAATLVGPVSADLQALGGVLRQQPEIRDRLESIRGYLNTHPQAGLTVVCISAADCQALGDLDTSAYSGRLRTARIAG